MVPGRGRDDAGNEPLDRRDLRQRRRRRPVGRRPCREGGPHGGGGLGGELRVRASRLLRIGGPPLVQGGELAHALSEDQGKPLVAEAYAEVDELSEYFHMAGEDAKRLEGSLPPSTSAGARVLVMRVPLGVVGVVSPWNWPYTMGAEVFAPALAAGNTVVWCPALDDGSLLGAARRGDRRGGLPPGVFNFLPGPGAIVGDGRRRAPGRGCGRLRRIGRHRAAGGRARGRQDPDPRARRQRARWSCSRTPTSSSRPTRRSRPRTCARGRAAPPGERFLVHASVRAEFVERVVAATAERVRLGDPFDPATTMGPLNNEPNAAKFDAHVGDARERGAVVCCGGRRARRATRLGSSREPTVLDGVTGEMVIAREETFGPVVPVIEISSDAEALEITNGSPFGLTAAVFTEDLERGLAFAEAARAGWVNINASTNVWESHLPFGGRSGSVSGRGRVGGRSLLEAFTEPKTIHFPAPRRPRELRRADAGAREEAHLQPMAICQLMSGENDRMSRTHQQGQRRHRRRRHRRQQPRLPPRPARLARSGARRQGPHAEPRGLHGPRLELHLPGRLLEDDDRAHRGQLGAVQGARGLHRERRDRGCADRRHVARSCAAGRRPPKPGAFPASC